jgi:hypothetical protein
MLTDAMSGSAGGLEDLIERFEAAQAANAQPELALFLPEPQNPLYRPVLVELIRVDLEYSWKRGTPKRLEDYVPLIAALADARDVLESIAFEEYRLRHQAGERPRLADLETRIKHILGHQAQR